MRKISLLILVLEAFGCGSVPTTALTLTPAAYPTVLDRNAYLEAKEEGHATTGSPLLLKVDTEFCPHSPTCKRQVFKTALHVRDSLSTLAILGCLSINSRKQSRGNPGCTANLGRHPEASIAGLPAASKYVSENLDRYQTGRRQLLAGPVRRR